MTWIKYSQYVIFTKVLFVVGAVFRMNWNIQTSPGVKSKISQYIQDWIYFDLIRKCLRVERALSYVKGVLFSLYAGLQNKTIRTRQYAKSCLPVILHTFLWWHLWNCLTYIIRFLHIHRQPRLLSKAADGLALWHETRAPPTPRWNFDRWLR